MRKLLLLVLLICTIQVRSQDERTEQIKKELNEHPRQDTFRVNRLIELSYSTELSYDERVKLTAEALSISKKTGYKQGEWYATANYGYYLIRIGNKKEGDSLFRIADSLAKKTGDSELIGIVAFRLGLIKFLENEGEKSIEYLLKAEEAFEKSGNYLRLSECQLFIMDFHQVFHSNYPPAMEYVLKATHSAEKANSSSQLVKCWTNQASIYSVIGDHANALIQLEKADSAIKNVNNKNYAFLQNTIGEEYRLTGRNKEALNAYKLALKYGAPENSSVFESNLAEMYTRMDSLPQAFHYAFIALEKAKRVENNFVSGWVHGVLARAYLKKGMPDSSIYFARSGLDSGIHSGIVEDMRDNAAALAGAYAYKKDFSNAYKYHLQFVNYRDSIMNTEVRNKTAVLKYNNDLGKKQVEISQLTRQKKEQQYFLISALIMLTLIIITAVLLLRNNRQKQQANKLLQKQKKEIDEKALQLSVQKDNLEQSNNKLNETIGSLKSTQAQLLQSEKMASLGELTAGIAHEIQNPLNFVNNFSEVNTDLLREMKEEIVKGNLEEVNLIAENLISNESKINHHGKRADSIVKNMLLHSRTGSGQTEPTDLNALADEYLRLAYHGVKAKDKHFNTELRTSFDPLIPKIELIPQDIGRVLLNLYNNAFYAVHARFSAVASTKAAGLATADGDFSPQVEVQTLKLNGHTQITVKDNGNGIPQKVLEKIFQPFFTTKPAGQGTGLGLSLSYDIVKAHGGNIRVTSVEGEGSEFIVELSL